MSLGEGWPGPALKVRISKSEVWWEAAGGGWPAGHNLKQQPHPGETEAWGLRRFLAGVSRVALQG